MVPPVRKMHIDVPVRNVSRFSMLMAEGAQSDMMSIRVFSTDGLGIAR